jgi:hypothetical protein
MVGMARLHGGAVGEAEVYQLLDGYARQAHVQVAVSHVRAGFAEIHRAAGGSCTGVMPSMAESMPQGKKMQWMLRVRNCAPEPWIVAFDVDISARYGLSRDSVRTEQWIFAADWSDPASP